MLVSSSSYTSASAAARSTPASASTASVASTASNVRCPLAGSLGAVGVPLPAARLTAALTTRSSSAADTARARPTTGGRTVRSAGGTTSVTCSSYTPRSSAASRCARPSSPHTTMCAPHGARRLTLIRNAPHEGEDCLTGRGGSTDEVNTPYGTPV